MEYTIVNTNQSINIDSTSGSATLTFYAGNKNCTSGDIVGNADKSTLSYTLNQSETIISNVTLTKVDDTAYSIKITYNANSSSSSRDCKLYLKNNEKQSTIYLTITQDGKSAWNNNTSYTFKIRVTSVACTGFYLGKHPDTVLLEDIYDQIKGAYYSGNNYSTTINLNNTLCYFEGSEPTNFPQHSNDDLQIVNVYVKNTDGHTFSSIGEITLKTENMEYDV